jgi:polycomb protein EED
VDCVQWVGNMIVSKSTTNVISVWKPRLNGDLSFDDTNDFEHLHDFKLQGCNAWFLRFAIDKNYRFMAIGNDVGDIKVWRLGESKKQINLTNSHSSSLIRMVSFSPNGKVLIGVRDDSTVWKYNIEQ